MLTRRLPSIRIRKAPASQVRWKSQPSNRRRLSSDLQHYPSTGFVSINRKRPPFAAADSKRVSPANSKSHLESSKHHEEPSLFAQLFPEEAQKSTSSQISGGPSALEVPPVKLPTVAELLEEIEDYVPPQHTKSDVTSEEEWGDEKSHKKTALLVLELASKSLVESDFRRIAPKGLHINGWTGLGDILKVFPGRDPRSLEQTNHYFILFVNPAYARAYSKHVHRLHRLAQKHTPTSIESPLTLQPGETIDDEDAHTMLQDFTLCLPSQRIHLKFIHRVLPPRMRLLIEQGGYLRLPDGTDRAGRSVLLWVDGNQPTSREIDDLISSDGRSRGMSWEVAIDRLDLSMPVPSEDARNSGSGDESEDTETSQQRRGPQKWVLTFSDEPQARRFIRAWHKRQLPTSQPEEPRIVQVEFLW